MDFDEAMKLILSEITEKGKEVAEAVKSRLNSVNNEAKTLRTRAKKAESDLTVLKEKKNPVLEVLSENGFELSSEDADVNAEIITFLDTLKNAQKNKTFDIAKEPAYIKQAKQLEKLLLKSETDDKEKLELKISGNKSTIKNSLLNSFSKEIMNGEKVLGLMIDSPKSKFKINDEGNVCFALKDGEEFTGIEEIMKEYKKAHPGEILNDMKSGGSTKSTDQNFNVPKKITSIAEVKDLSVDQIRGLTKEQNAQMHQVIASQ